MTDEQKKVAKSVDEVQKNVDEAEEQGYLGVKADPRPNSDYSLESGPDSPSAAEQLVDVHQAAADQLQGNAS